METTGVPPVHYAKSGSAHIAYQVLGEGPIDLVVAPGAVSHLDVYWENPDLVAFIRDLAEFSRVILFDKRGTGLSDRAVGVPTLEDRIDDIRAVMDEAKSPRAVLFGFSEGSTMCTLFAATHPERTLGLIVLGGYARGPWADDYPWGNTKEDSRKLVESVETNWEGWVDEFTHTLAPSRIADPTFQAWCHRLIRYSSTPGSIIALGAMNQLIDVRSVLSSVRVPTLVLHATDDRFALADEGRYVAAHVPGARFVPFSSPDHFFFVDSSTRRIVTGEIEGFLRGLHASPEPERVLTTVLFTDISRSTEQLSALGDRAWGRLLHQHFSDSRELIAHFRGTEIKTTGDGLMATFDGPTRAVRCAREMRNRGQMLGLQVRAGLHTGECLLKDADVEGIAVHIASRVMDLARPGEVLVSGTVRDLSAGSDLVFVDRGKRTLRGVREKWRIFEAAPGERNGPADRHSGARG